MDTLSIRPFTRSVIFSFSFKYLTSLLSVASLLTMAVLSFLFDASSTHFAIILTSSITVFCVYHFLIGTTRRHLPPGPTPVFFIGNILQLASEQPEALFQKWAAKFGLCSPSSSKLICLCDAREYCIHACSGTAHDCFKQPRSRSRSYGEA